MSTKLRSVHSRLDVLFHHTGHGGRSSRETKLPLKAKEMQLLLHQAAVAEKEEDTVAVEANGEAAEANTVAVVNGEVAADGEDPDTVDTVVPGLVVMVDTVPAGTTLSHGGI